MTALAWGLVVILGLTIWLAGAVILLIFAGLLFGVFLDGLSDLLRRHARLPGRWATLVTLAGFLFFATTVGGLIAWRTSAELPEMMENLQTAWKQVQQYIDGQIWTRPFFATPNGDRAATMRSEWLQRIAGVFSTALGAVVSGAFVFFVGVFFAFDMKLYRRGMLRLVPMARRERAAHVMHEVGSQLWWWIWGKVLSGLIVAVAIGMGLWLYGIPAPLTLALIAFALTFIPNFGPITSAIPAVLLALPSSVYAAVYVVLLYLVVQIIESFILTPLIQQKNVKLPPILNLAAQVLLGVLFGVPGLLVAPPMVVAGMVLVKRLYVEDILGDRMDEDDRASSPSKSHPFK